MKKIRKVIKENIIIIFTVAIVVILGVVIMVRNRTISYSNQFNGLANINSEDGVNLSSEYKNENVERNASTKDIIIETDKSETTVEKSSTEETIDEESNSNANREVAIGAYYELLTSQSIDWSVDEKYDTDKLRFKIVDMISDDYPILILETYESSHMNASYKIFEYLNGELLDLSSEVNFNDVLGYYGNSGVIYFGYGMQGEFSEYYYLVDPTNGKSEFIASRRAYEDEESSENAFSHFHISTNGVNEWAMNADNANENEFSNLVNGKANGENRTLCSTPYGWWLYEANGILYDNNSENRSLYLR